MVTIRSICNNIELFLQIIDDIGEDMSFLISDAVAEAAPVVAQPGWEGMLFPVGILVFFTFYF